ncbi:1,4-alpha-glucan branching protein [Gordonia desulfuricans]|uniref:1,4-alpha-glucan branching protein n=1 Tax=Gordonia desulfuricans TaxID=89051 RepID=A0A7K3LKN5_9ACTN|nr:hypothetical protein [Gordonia desulfuricans]NDK88107.1 1,4-alpha-glucan branching protein [Gordonia desulfuricans]
MATIHNTTLVPSKLELLTAWLPDQPWFRGSDAPHLVRSGGFRLDDPAGEVGMEILLVTDTSVADHLTYVVPLTYRGVHLDGAALVGTAAHGVLGIRYVYDAPSDPVFVAQLAALARGEVRAQAQSASDTVDDTVAVQGGGDAWQVNRIITDTTGSGDVAGTMTAVWTAPDGSAHRGTVAWS